jgi:hypothetical protein
MRATSLVFFIPIGLGHALDIGRTRSRPELAFGAPVDYDSIKLAYPFMARLVMDNYQCGGAVIADRSDSSVFKSDNEHAFLAAEAAQEVTLSLGSIFVSVFFIRYNIEIGLKYAGGYRINYVNGHSWQSV